MNLNDLREMSFEQIEHRLGIESPGPVAADGYPLEVWYCSVTQKPLGDFSVEDLCKACRQALYSDYIVPLAVDRLQDDPEAGELYSGELLVALKSIPIDFWSHQQETANTLKGVIKHVLAYLDEEVRKDATELLSHLP